MLILLLTAGSIIAHHGYADYDREAAVSLEGTVKHVLWANPHVVLTLQTQNRGEYAIEWNAASQLARQGIQAAPVKAGDRLLITGSINKNPEKRILTLLREISRPADGWHWENPNRPTPASAK
jgi:hypothetical protein